MLLSTFASTLIAIIYVGIRQHLNLLNRGGAGLAGGITLFIGILIAVFSQMDQQTMIFWSKVVSNVLLFTIIVTFIVGALHRSG